MRIALVALMSLTLCACMGELQLIRAAATADRDEPRPGDRVIVHFADGEQRRVVLESINSQTVETADGPIPWYQVVSIEVDQSSPRARVERAARVTAASMLILVFWALLFATGG